MYVCMHAQDHGKKKITVMFSGEGARVEWDDKVCPEVA